MRKTALTSFFHTLIWPICAVAWFMLFKLTLEGKGFVTVTALELAINMFIGM